MTAQPPGTLIWSGRNADVYDTGDGRVLRRYRDGRDPGRVAAEAQVMVYARAHGVPAPAVFDVSGMDIVMERAAGPTMLEAIGRRPWTAGTHARLLARLHALVHRVPGAGLAGLELRPLARTAADGATAGETARPGDSDVLLHGDLHPQNVILTADGRVIIDWEGAQPGPAAADVAMTWLIIVSSDVPGPRLRTAPVRGVQAVFGRAFLRSAGPVDDRTLAAVVRLRLADPNILPAEAVRLRKLASADLAAAE